MAPRESRADGMTITLCKTLGAAMVVLLAACATVPVEGDAVNCDACRTMWIRLYSSSGAPGIYRLNHDEKHPPCLRCQGLAVRHFEGSGLAPRCARCGGNLALLPVRVTR